MLLALQWPQPDAAVPAWRQQLEQQLLSAGGAQVVAREALRWVLAFDRARDAAAAAMALQRGWQQAGPAAGEAPRCGLQVGELDGEGTPPGADRCRPGRIVGAGRHRGHFGRARLA